MPAHHESCWGGRERLVIVSATCPRSHHAKGFAVHASERQMFGYLKVDIAFVTMTL